MFFRTRSGWYANIVQDGGLKTGNRKAVNVHVYESTSSEKISI